ncbi:unnamed protein product [Ectocarpus sp. 12 AP-2014]
MDAVVAGSSVNGSGKALSKEEITTYRAELDALKAEFSLKEPERSFMDDPDTKWRFGCPPDYTLANLAFLKGRSKAHPEGSLELIVENLVKTWEMERSHKLDHMEHRTVDQERFSLSANGGKKYNNKEANAAGNYNVLLESCPKEMWDSEGTTWEESHAVFHGTFDAFPWEVLEVFSGPPTVGFTWRHWANFDGSYQGNAGEGQLVEMYGFGVATVNDKLQLCDVDLYFDPKSFMEILRGERDAGDVQGGTAVVGPLGGLKGGCPHLEMLRKNAAGHKK